MKNFNEDYQEVEYAHCIQNVRAHVMCTPPIYLEGLIRNVYRLTEEEKDPGILLGMIVNSIKYN